MQELYIPRKHYITPKEKIANCPDCDELLVEEKCVVLLYGRSDVDEGEFMTNKNGSHFCHNCPVVVFEQEVIEETLTSVLKSKEWFSYGILGFVDLDALAEDENGVGEEEKPITLIGFLPNPDMEAQGISLEDLPKIQSVRKKQPHKFGRKVNRNEPCPCGSGKKYKKCCI